MGKPLVAQVSSPGSAVRSWLLLSTRSSQVVLDFALGRILPQFIFWKEFWELLGYIWVPHL